MFEFSVENGENALCLVLLLEGEGGSSELRLRGRLKKNCSQKFCLILKKLVIHLILNITLLVKTFLLINR